AIATANRVLMLEHAIYSVISPEGAASILWRDTAKAQEAATNMKITARDLMRFGIIDTIVEEPVGGAHRDPPTAIAATGAAIAQIGERGSVGSPALRAYSPWARGGLTAGALALAAMLAGCETDGVEISAKALRPLSAQLTAELERKHMPKESPILVRLFKEEAELEVWKQDDTGRFAPLVTYPICRWSGELGPKIKQGDRQAPEGFYTITPAQLNPNSHYYLSFDIGYPNA